MHKAFALLTILHIATFTNGQDIIWTGSDDKIQRNNWEQLSERIGDKLIYTYSFKGIPMYGIWDTRFDTLLIEKPLTDRPHSYRDPSTQMLTRFVLIKKKSASVVVSILSSSTYNYDSYFEIDSLGNVKPLRKLVSSQKIYHIYDPGYGQSVILNHGGKTHRILKRGHASPGAGSKLASEKFIVDSLVFFSFRDSMFYVNTVTNQVKQFELNNAQPNTSQSNLLRIGDTTYFTVSTSSDLFLVKVYSNKYEFRAIPNSTLSSEKVLIGDGNMISVVSKYGSRIYVTNIVPNGTISTFRHSSQSGFITRYITQNDSIVLVWNGHSNGTYSLSSLNVRSQVETVLLDQLDENIREMTGADYAGYGNCYVGLESSLYRVRGLGIIDTIIYNKGFSLSYSSFRTSGFLLLARNNYPESGETSIHYAVFGTDTIPLTSNETLPTRSYYQATSVKNNCFYISGITKDRQFALWKVDFNKREFKLLRKEDISLTLKTGIKTAGNTHNDTHAFLLTDRQTIIYTDGTKRNTHEFAHPDFWFHYGTFCIDGNFFIVVRELTGSRDYVGYMYNTTSAKIQEQFRLPYVSGSWVDVKSGLLFVAFNRVLHFDKLGKKSISLHNLSGGSLLKSDGDFTFVSTYTTLYRYQEKTKTWDSLRGNFTIDKKRILQKSDTLITYNSKSEVMEVFQGSPIQKQLFAPVMLSPMSATSSIDPSTGRYLYGASNTTGNYVRIDCKNRKISDANFYPIQQVNYLGSSAKHLFIQAELNEGHRNLYSNAGGSFNPSKPLLDFHDRLLPIVDLNGVFYREHFIFSCGKDQTGIEVWASNGTRSRTAPIAEVYEGLWGSYPVLSCVINDRLLFNAYDSTNGYALRSLKLDTIILTMSLTPLCMGDSTIEYCANWYSFIGDSIVNSVVYFGDGDSSTASSGKHTYSTPGTYTLRYVAIDNNGKQHELKKTFGVQALNNFGIKLPPYPANGDSICITLENKNYRYEWKVTGANIVHIENYKICVRVSDTGKFSMEVRASNGICTGEYVRLWQKPVNMRYRHKISDESAYLITTFSGGQLHVGNSLNTQGYYHVYDLNGKRIATAYSSGTMVHFGEISRGKVYTIVFQNEDLLLSKKVLSQP